MPLASIGRWVGASGAPHRTPQASCRTQRLELQTECRALSRAHACQVRHPDDASGSSNCVKTSGQAGPKLLQNLSGHHAGAPSSCKQRLPCTDRYACIWDKMTACRCPWCTTRPPLGVQPHGAQVATVPRLQKRCSALGDRTNAPETARHSIFKQLNTL